MIRLARILLRVSVCLRSAELLCLKSNLNAVVKVCPSGQTPNSGRTACDSCAPGETDLEDVTLPAGKACALCPAGKIPPNSQNGPCISCAAGRYDDDSSPVTACKLCSAGRWSNPGALLCTTCSNGKYLDVNATAETSEARHDSETDCVPCVAGQADTDLDPTTVCSVCPSGTFSATGAFVCSNCPAGEYSGNPGSVECSRCDPGYFARPTFCQPCPAGKADTDVDPATECDVCVAGQYSSQEVCNTHWLSHATDALQ